MMIADSVSDPRRANWLTISTSEDFCWPEENGANRPSWELEAEILRLTTRLMMQERELRQVKVQLKSQVRCGEQQMATWRRKMVEKEEQLQRLLEQKDSEMQSIVSQLLLFEAELRQEQGRIEGLLKEKDSTIQRQQQEIQRLQSLVGVSKAEAGDETTVPASDKTALERRSSAPADRDTEAAVKKIKDGLVRIRAIQDLTNVRSRCDKAPAPEPRIEGFLVEKRRAAHKTPQKMKDLKAKRIHLQHRGHRPDFCGQVIL